MSAPKPSAITIEEAVARMVSLDYLPEGFTVQDITSAFLGVAEAEHENARTAQRETQAIRAHVCEARHALAQALFAAMECELDRGDDSMLVSSEDSAGIKRVTTESLSQWASDQFGISAPEWEPWNFNPVLEGIRWEDVKIKIGDKYKIGYSVKKGHYKWSTFKQIGLMGIHKIVPNQLGGILIGLSIFGKYPGVRSLRNGDPVAITKLRGSLKAWTGISGEPFSPFNKTDGWKPRFELIDGSSEAEERAMKKFSHVPWEDDRDSATEEGQDDDDTDS